MSQKTPVSTPAAQPAPEARDAARDTETRDTDARAALVAAAVKRWQSELVNLGGRNTLLWFRDLPFGTLDLTTAHPGGVAKLLAGRPTKLSELVREPAALHEARRRARTIRSKALELHEERGITTGFIAIGMATWTIRGASRSPAAPVLLRSCVLKPTDAAYEDFSLDLGTDVELNPVLEHYLRSEQGIDLDPVALEELAGAGNGFDPYPVYAGLQRLCAQVPDFVVSPRLVVGNFSYAKLPMVADLAAQGDRLADHDVVAALAGDAGALADVRRSVPESRPDPDPSREQLVLDADSSQQTAIDAVRSGAHLVIQGPPGTGKSQTIANLIASLAADGRRVLFVAEKRAAIDTVISRLARVGLSDLVLDTYDGASPRARITQQLGDALDRATGARDPDTTEVERDVLATRHALGEHLQALHSRREPWGVSAYEAQEAISALEAQVPAPRSRVRIRGGDLSSLTRERMKQLERDLTEAASRGAWSTDGARDPWYSARVTTSEEAVRARDIAGGLSESGLDEVQKTLDEVFADVRLPEAETVADWGRALSTVAKVRDTLEVFRPDVFDMPLGELVDATGSRQDRQARGADLSWFSRMQLRRQARRLLRPGPPPADLHAALIDAQSQRLAWQQMAGAGGRPELPVDLDRAQTAYDVVERDLTWLGERLATTAAGGDLLHTPLPDLEHRLTELARRPERLTVIPEVIAFGDRLRAAGLGPLVDDLAARRVGAEEVARELEFVWWTSVTEDLTASDPRYGRHDGDQLRRVACDFALADRRHLEGNARQVRAAVGRRVRKVLADNPQQESSVRAEAGKARRHKALRDLLPLAGETLTAVRPCWAMSPLVVASMVPPGTWFDVVIFDEASQTTPARAISAISRATQVVIVGDEQQLSPTTFFTAASDEEDVPREGSPDALESVLDVLAAVLPTRRLTWHYRSFDERLIGFANREMYDGALVTFPGTAGASVLHLESVDGSGVLEQGQATVESTTAEVDRVVELVLEHARTRPRESLGVVALSSRHAARIQEALRRALAREESLAAFFDDEAMERFFVKHLERVQGDERDTIIVSIGFGKTPHGRVLHRFGLLNLEGGERGLNVAITRARRRMTVVSSLRPEDLDPPRLKARGAVMLRDLLSYAANAGDAPAVTGGGARGEESASRLRDGFARRLRQASLVVHEDYGGSQPPIDFVVEDPYHPGQVLVAVESDGPAYAGMSSTRERERLRVEQLERLGWRHVRVWSTDLYRDPARDVARVVAAATEGRRE